MASFDFQVGGTKGWIVPPPNDTNIYNDWASNNRFQLGDTIYFSYKKDSVMEVSERDYKECNATHPTFFSNIGNTVFKLEHSRTFYFISGASGHYSWVNFSGNIGKVLLSLVSIFFDLLFMCQHYVLYPSKRTASTPSHSRLNNKLTEPLIKSHDQPVAANIPVAESV
ncbi:hypothetical protein TanjilG_01585 [Lupinus angustifolius]|nr:hypothetical protein TanjilG_01585 [Lupinus angustifolius]